jgi:hypothetical protein
MIEPVNTSKNATGIDQTNPVRLGSTCHGDIHCDKFVTKQWWKGDDGE